MKRKGKNGRHGSPRHQCVDCQWAKPLLGYPNDRCTCPASAFYRQAVVPTGRCGLWKRRST